MCVGDVVGGTQFLREEETSVKFWYQIMGWHSFIKSSIIYMSKSNKISLFLKKRVLK